MKYKIMLVLILLVAFPHQAYAYLDPGTGVMIIQGTIAAIAAAGAALGLYWKRIKSLFVKNHKENAMPQAPDIK